jgi:hypothetical protein
LRWVVAHQNNKDAPKIVLHDDGSIVKIYKSRSIYQWFDYKPKRSQQRIGIVQLRKLEPITDRKVIDDFCNYVMGFLDDNIRQAIIDKVTPHLRNVDRRFVIISQLKMPELSMIAQNSKNSDPDLSELFMDLARLFNKFKFVDFKSDNFMWDPVTDHIVVIDPLAH